MNVELRRPRRADRPSPTSSPSTWPRPPRPSGSSTPSCWPRPSPACASSTWPGAASSTRTAWPTPSRAGHVGGAALDVFAEEPTTESPLFELDEVVVTPHLGASTREAQDKAGDTIAEQVGLALAGEFVPFAVNVDAAEASETVRPFLPLAERLGGAVRRAGRRASAPLEIEYQGQIGRLRHPHPHPLGAQGLLRPDQRRAGVLRERPAAGRGAGHRGPRDVHHRPATTTSTSITLRGGDHSIAGTLVGLRGASPASSQVDDHTRRRAAGAPHARGAQRRPPRRDRPGRHHPGRRRRQHRRHGRRAVRRRRVGAHGDRHQRARRRPRSATPCVPPTASSSVASLT